MITDKRVIKTKNAIKAAFMSIILEKDISKITVSDIAEKALINRSTFYLHYSDVNSVMTDIEKELAQTVSRCYEKLNADDIHGSIYAMLTKITGTLAEDQIMKKFILYSTNSTYVIEKVKNIFVQKTYESLEQLHYVGSRDKLYYTITFIISGVIDSYIKWANNPDPDISLEGLCKTLGQLADICINELLQR
jgi:AcrR family transcriptional regulator